MGGGAQALKRIPRIKFPPRHPKSSPSPSSQNQPTPASADAPRTFFSSSPSSMSAGGKASDQPKRISLSPEEIEAIMDAIRGLTTLKSIRIINQAASFLEEFQSATSSSEQLTPSEPLPSGWIKPPMGTIKTNVDAGYKDGIGTVGVVIRSHSGSLLATLTMNLGHVASIQFDYMQFLLELENRRDYGVEKSPLNLIQHSVLRALIQMKKISSPWDLLLIKLDLLVDILSLVISALCPESVMFRQTFWPA